MRRWKAAEVTLVHFKACEWESALTSADWDETSARGRSGAATEGRPVEAQGFPEELPVWPSTFKLFNRSLLVFFLLLTILNSWRDSPSFPSSSLRPASASNNGSFSSRTAPSRPAAWQRQRPPITTTRAALINTSQTWWKHNHRDESNSNQSFTNLSDAEHVQSASVLNAVQANTQVYTVKHNNKNQQYVL